MFFNIKKTPVFVMYKILFGEKQKLLGWVYWFRLNSVQSGTWAKSYYALTEVQTFLVFHS